MLSAALITLALLAALLLVLHFQARASDAAEPRVAERIEALLPQTQCGRCTFTGCKPYAQAIARGEAGINQCPPGGAATVHALARLLGRPAQPVGAEFGSVPTAPVVAWIGEAACIGCAKCIQACPVDAIIGAAKFMHTVLSQHCTGCELCIPPCPVDCIELRPLAAGTSTGAGPHFP
jgi:Na+-translocating ferredoxin:NAD+ oxidoreductase subunit B